MNSAKSIALSLVFEILFMKLSVIIPSKNGLHHLKECLPSVLRAVHSSSLSIDVTVVDDNSSDGSLAALRMLFPSVQVLSNPLQGACSARNWGVQHSQGEWICFLDNDVFLEETFFNTLATHLKEDVFCVSCAGYAAYPKQPGVEEQLDGIKVLNWKRGFPRFTGNIYNNELPQQDEYLCWGVQGAYFACNRKKFDDLGGFDTLFDPYLLEETDLAYRGLKRGWKITYAKDTHPHHKCGGTINSKQSPRTKYLSKRNRILFVWKNIQSKRLLFSHVLWLLLCPNFRAIYECWKMWPNIQQKRKEERSCAIYSDGELMCFSNKTRGRV